jgi:hypothetical protein
LREAERVLHMKLDRDRSSTWILDQSRRRRSARCFGEVPVDRGSRDAKLAGDFCDGVEPFAVWTKFVVHLLG